MEWPTDLIGFDAAKTYASPSYWAQALFASHLGDGTAESSISGAHERFFYSATVDTKARVLHLKLVNASSADQPLSITLPGVENARAASVARLHGATFEATNTMSDPDAIHPVESQIAVTNGRWSETVPALTIEVIDVPF
jgi:alpha-N-arabinofuranosidase